MLLTARVLLISITAVFLYFAVYSIIDSNNGKPTDFLGLFKRNIHLDTIIIHKTDTLYITRTVPKSNKRSKQTNETYSSPKYSFKGNNFTSPTQIGDHNTQNNDYTVKQRHLNDTL